MDFLSFKVKSRLPSVLRNVLSNWTGLVCSSTIAFFLSPFVVHRLGPSAYGVWILVGSLSGYLGLLNLGVRAAVTRYVAKLHAEANHRESSAVVSTALAIFVVLGLLTTLVSLGISESVLPRFHIPENYRFAARIIVILAGFNIGISLVGGVFGGIVAALHRFDLINLIDVATSALSALAVVAVLSSGRGLVALAVVNLSFAIAAALAYTGIAFYLYPALRIRFADCDGQRMRLIFSFSVYAFVLQVSYNLIFYTDSVVIAAFLSVSFIAVFAIAGNLISSARALISGISTTMTPRATMMEVTHGQNEVKELLSKASKLATLVVLPVAVTFLLRGSSFIRLWMGEEYARPSGRILCILTLALIFSASNQVATSTMMGLGKHRTVVLAVCCEAVCNLGLSLVLVHRLGIEGVAWGTTLPSLTISLVFWPWYLRRSFGIPIRGYLMSTWLRPGIAAVPFGLLTYWIEKAWPAPNLSIFFLQVGGILPAMLLASWCTCLDHSQQEIYGRLLLKPTLRILGGQDA